MMRPEEKELVPLYVDAILTLFRRGLDTADIAAYTHRPEAAVERWLHRGLDQQYLDRSS